MLAACASDGDGDIAAVIACQGAEPILEKSLNVGQHCCGIRLGLKVLDDWLVKTGEIAQPDFVMRIRKHAHVENEIGVKRNAALERKRFKDKGQLYGGH